MRQQKRLLALALAGAFATPTAVLAQTAEHKAPGTGPEHGETARAASVQIYGTLNMNFQTTARTGATAAGTTGLATLAGPATGIDGSRRTAVSKDSSNIGFRGVEDLGGGLKATFQIESNANIDGDALTGSVIGSRNSKLGIAGPFGELFFGFWDTPYKAGTYGTKVQDPFRSTDVFGFQSIMSSPGFNQRSGSYASGTNNASFDNRASNSVNYWTHPYQGFTAKLAYSANEGKTAGRNPYLWSLSTNYDNGPLSLLYSYELHKDAFGLTVMQATSTATSSKDVGHRLGAGFAFGDTILSILWERLDYRNSGTVAGVTRYRRDAWQLGALHRIGAHEFKLRYNQAQDGSCTNVAGNCSTGGLGARQWTLGYGYHLSKRTELYAFYTKIRNDYSASYTLTIGGAPGVVTGPGIGSDPTAAGLGIRHSF
ncbi:MAG: porin [Pseudomonadota bacterium]|jgi:predicted porin